MASLFQKVESSGHRQLTGILRFSAVASHNSQPNLHPFHFLRSASSRYPHIYTTISPTQLLKPQFAGKEQLAMADGTTLNTAFAPPPPLWKHFTPENVRKLEQIKKEASKGEDGKPQKKAWSAKELRSLTLPPELRFLVPPDIPSEQYSVFGEMQSVGRKPSFLLLLSA